MSYRQLKIQKRVKRTGKIRRYKNLATFNKECAKSANAAIRPSTTMMCTLENARTLKDGSGLATVRVKPLIAYWDEAKGKHKPPSLKQGTWLLHFASASVMKKHLKGRVAQARAGMLDGAKRKRRRR